MLTNKKLLNIFMCVVFVFTSSHVYGADGVPTANPGDPGPEPVNNCSTSGISAARAFESCARQFQQKYEAWQRQKAAYEAYLIENNKSDSATAAGTVTVDQVLKERDRAIKRAKQNKFWGGTSDILGQLAMTVGSAMMVSGFTSCFITLGGSCTIFFIGLGLTIVGYVLKSLANNLRNKAAQHEAKAQELAGLLEVACGNVQKMSGAAPANCENISGEGGGFYADMPTDDFNPDDMIDPKTQQCKPDAPQFCASFVKSLDEACKGKKLTSCMASLKKDSKKAKVKVNPNGTVTTQVNGKSMTFGENTFDSPESMVKAGFSPAQAQAFFKGDGPSSKKKADELKNQIKKDMEISFGSDYFSGDYGTNNNMSSSDVAKKKFSDEMKAKPSQNNNSTLSARAPSSEVQSIGEETIGTSNSDLFQMAKRRYQLKMNQSSFVEP